MPAKPATQAWRRVLDPSSQRATPLHQPDHGPNHLAQKQRLGHRRRLQIEQVGVERKEYRAQALRLRARAIAAQAGRDPRIRRDMPAPKESVPQFRWPTTRTPAQREASECAAAAATPTRTRRSNESGNRRRAAQCADAPPRRHSSAAHRCCQLHSMAISEAAAANTRTAKTSRHGNPLAAFEVPRIAFSVKVRQLSEQVEPFVDLGPRQLLAAARCRSARRQTIPSRCRKTWRAGTRPA